MGRSYRMKALTSKRNTYLKEEIDRVQDEEVDSIMEEAEILFTGGDVLEDEEGVIC